ncbi:MAG: DNA polymerase IV [Acidobacteria bacterium]|nr:DNA polymerase IV [Acidobacteriota bacterium]
MVAGLGGDRPRRDRAPGAVSFPAGSGVLRRAGRVILHVDMDAFFVSVEQLYDPSLRGKPVIVGGRPNQRGVVAAASYEARRFGVHSAMPLTQAVRLCPQAILVPVHRQRYEEASERIEEIFQEFSPRVEMVSVDEAYLDLTGTERLWGTPLQAAHRLHAEIARRTHLPCSIGISGSHLVSKIASDQAKPNGILWVLPGQEAGFLAPLPIGRIPGVGPVTEKNMRGLGVGRVQDLARLNPQVLEAKLGQFGLELLAKARGEDAWEPDLSSEWDFEERARSVSHEETFDEDSANSMLLESALADLSQRVAARLRDQKLYARTIALKLRYSNFRTISRARTLPEPTNTDGVILEAARHLFRENWDVGQKVRLLGVQASGLSPWPGQGNLWTASVEHKWGQALAAADRLRERFGFSAIQLATAMPMTAVRKKPGESTLKKAGKPLR